MKYLTHSITGIDGSTAHLYGYILDNSPEVDIERVRPSVLILPGGGYEMTSDREAEPIAMQFLAAGYQAFVLRYSVKSSVYPTALLEVAEALTWIRSNSDKLHIQPSQIAVLGFSAGGHLAANISTVSSDEDLIAHGYTPADIRPNGLILCYPVLSSGKFAHEGSFASLLGSEKNNPTLREKLSIEKHVDAQTPPTFIWHTITDDCVSVENSLLFIQACKNAGVSIEAHLFPEGGHGLALGTMETAWGGNPETTLESIQIWITLALQWMQRTFQR